MRYRKLRIAWSVVWGIATVLVVVLWVRSYFRFEGATHGRAADNTGLFIVSTSGKLVYQRVTVPVVLQHSWFFDSIPADEQRLIGQNLLNSTSFGFLFISSRTGYVYIVPYWFMALLFGCLGVVGRVRFHFSLRTLLIAATLVAVVLGLIVAVLRWPAS
jgi:hypothetical protein